MKNLMMVCGLLALGGCSTYPALPKAPPPPAGDTPAAKLDKLGVPFGGIVTLVDAKLRLAQYYRLYADEASKKRKNGFAADETGFLMATLGVLGGIGKSVETAAAGALGAAGAGVYSDRYNLKLQANNYALAARSIRCMYFLTEDIAPSVDKRRSEQFTDNGTPVPTDVLKTIRQNFIKVHDRLQSLQDSFQLGQPDLGKLSAAVARREVSSTGVTLTDAERSETDALGQFRDEMEKCAAMIVG